MKKLKGLCLLAFILSLLNGCLGDMSVSREPTTIRTVQVDSLRFIPAGLKYIADSSATLLLQNMHTGFSCAVLSDINKKDTLSEGLLAFKPSLAATLPADENCPLDNGKRDTLLKIAVKDSSRKILLLNSQNKKTDSVEKVKGQSYIDSLIFIMSSKDSSVIKGKFIYRDTLGGQPKRTISSMQLGTCEKLNFANYRQHADTLSVKFGWVILDSIAEASHCKFDTLKSISVIPEMALP